MATTGQVRLTQPKARKFFFELPAEGRVYVFYCTEEKDTAGWMAAINACQGQRR